MLRRIVCLLPFVFAGCVSIPEGIKPVQDFDIHRYLGTWYEIARLDHSFERGLESVTAQYGLRQDGGVHVINRGFHRAKNTWKEAVGKAYLMGDANTGSLKVSFFGPFYGGYHVIALDKVDYSYALVCGPSKNYLWILARKSTMEDSVISALIEQATALGFETEKLIMVRHEQG